MNERRQRRVLYREFLFRIVDRELLSSHSTGDASQLLLQLLTLFVWLSVLFSVPALFLDPGSYPPQVRLIFAWNLEHFLIATTMLTVGVFAVLGWGSMFPDQRDIHVLAPLPVRAHTILLAKIAATGTELAAIVLALHVVTSLMWPLWLNTASGPDTIPALTSESALPPVGADDLQAVLDMDLAVALREGALAAGGGAGVSIGVSTHGTRRVFAYGAARPDSVFPIASVTKVFTGLVLAHMIEQGTVRADEPVRELIPRAGLVRPANGRSEITLGDLVTHHSGLPGMPADFRPRDPGNPYADFDVGRLYAFLSTRGVARPPDANFRYSNVGFGLLGHALATRAGVSYETLVRQLIAQPLAMTDTAVVLTPDQQRRLMQGYDPEHHVARSWDVPTALAGAGALNSTASDLLTWLESHLHPERLPPGTLPRAITRSHQRQTGADDGAGVAFAWFLSPTGDFVHSGDMAGFSAEVWFNPSKERALVVLANTARGTSVSADVLGEHIRARLDGLPPIALADTTIPAYGSLRSWLRLFVAYWLTMLAASLFVFCLTFGVQGLASAVLPHRYFMRASSLLQLGVFCVVVGTYFLQPIMVTPTMLFDAQRATPFGSPPSYWFLGLFQALSGSPALAPLAGQAVTGLSVAVIIATGVCGLSYVRTLRRLAEEPDIAPAVQAARRLPSVGSSLHTAVVHFSVRTLLRSAQHRIIFTFYLGIGFVLSAVFLKTPRAQEVAANAASGTWDATSMPLIVSSVVMLVCAVVGARLTFAIPRDLPANWIFRIVPPRSGSRYASGRRRAFVLIAAGPAWVLSAGVFLARWPWVPAIGHLIILVLLGSIFVELCLSGPQGIPFTCSYLPGTSRTHVSVLVAIVMLLLLTLVLADAERRALQDAGSYATLVGALALVWISARWRTSWLANAVAEPEFEDEPVDRLVSLDVWDSRIASRPSGQAASPR
jgi:CubicO group peptidase (beta-lactamase class C family)